MFRTATYSHLAKSPTMDTHRMLIWIEEPSFQGFGCSECAWVFNPSGPPSGNSLEEMKEYYEQRRDKEFGAHHCAEHPRATMTEVQISRTGPPRTARVQRDDSTE
jgi:hypothetical protein